MTNTLMKCVTTLAVIVALAPEPARAQRVIPPAVPEDIQVPAGNKAFLVGHAVGTQNYICQESSAAPSGVAWVLFGPQATLFNEYGGEIMTHFLSLNPDESAMPRPTWQHSRDTSRVWAVAARPPVAVPDAIPWLLLQVVGDDFGPRGGGRLVKATYIHRVNTIGGVAPAEGCELPAQINNRTFVPYEADYVFYKDRLNRDDD